MATYNGDNGNNYINGSSGGDSIIGNYGNDTLAGHNGNDTIFGNGNNDTLYGGWGADQLWGGKNRDRLEGAQGNDTLWGGEDNDTLFGYDGDDVLYGASGEFGSQDGDDKMYGENGNDYLDGQDGNDTLDGGLGNDTILGGSGNDLVLGMDGNDSLDGGDGQDTLNGYQGHDTLRGGSGNDQIGGVFGDDKLYGDSGNDTLNGNDGQDFLNGGDGSDELWGGNGNDELWGGNNADVLGGGEGNDSLNGDSGNDFLYGNNGHDVLKGGDGSDRLEGASGNDTIYGNHGSDTVYGGYGNDIIHGGNSNHDSSDSADTIYGNEGEDTIYGNGGNDLIYGGNTYEDPGDQADSIYGGHGNDTIISNGGNDIVYGNEGSDMIYGGQGNDIIHGGNSNHDSSDSADTIYGNAGEDTIYGNGGNDLIYGGNSYEDPGDQADNIYGGHGNDTIISNGGNDIVYGNEGSDMIYGGQGNDYVTGDDDNDHIEGGIGNDSLFGNNHNDTLFGNEGNDHLEGGAGNDVLDGGSGTDTIYGNSGTNQIKGGLGSDVLYGGTGSDSYIFENFSQSNPSQYDKIYNFQLGIDKLNLEQLGPLEICLEFNGQHTIVKDVTSQFEVWLMNIDLTDTLAESDFIGDVSFKTNDDSYIYNPGFTTDTVLDSEGTDEAIFKQMDVEEFKFSYNGNDLVITHKNDQKSITFQSQTQAQHQIETFTFGKNESKVFSKISVLNSFDGTFDEDSSFTIPIDNLNQNAIVHNNDNWITEITPEGIKFTPKENINGLFSDQIVIENGTELLALNYEIDLTPVNDAPIQIIDSVIINEDSELTLNLDELFEDVDGDELSYSVITESGLGNSVVDGNTLTYTPNVDIFGSDEVKITVSDGTVTKEFQLNVMINDIEDTATTDIKEIQLGQGELVLNDFSKHIFATNDEQYQLLSVSSRLGKPTSIDEDDITYNYWPDNLNETDVLDVIVQDNTGNKTKISVTVIPNGLQDHAIIIEGSDQAQIHYGTSNNDEINGLSEADTIFGGNGDDIINGGSSDDNEDGGDLIYGGMGNDTLYGNGGNDTLFGEDGNDSVLGWVGDDELDGGSGNDYLFGDDGHDIVQGAEGDDTLYGGEGDDQLSGGSGNDMVFGDNGNDTLKGEEGNDLIHGWEGNDQLEGGEGNDTLSGENGDDTYIFDSGFGHDHVFEKNGVDGLQFNGLELSDFEFSYIDNNLVISHKNGEDSVTLHDQNNAMSKIEKMTFGTDEITEFTTITHLDNVEQTVNEDQSFTIPIDNLDTEAIVHSNDNWTTEITSEGIIFTPNENSNGQFTDQLRIENGSELIIFKINIDITPINDAPIQTVENITIDEDTQLTLNLDELFEDVDGDELSYSVSNPSELGDSVLIDGNTLRYTPNDNIFGSDQIHLTVSDGTNSYNYQVGVNVNSVDDTSTTDIKEILIGQGMVFVCDLIQHMFDSDSVGLTIDEVSSRNGVSIQMSGDHLTYNIQNEFHDLELESDILDIKVKDQDGNETIISIDVNKHDQINTNIIVEGNDDANTHIGTWHSDQISGQGGDDTLIGMLGDDTLIGGEGEDLYLLDSESVYTNTIIDDGGKIGIKMNDTVMSLEGILTYNDATGFYELEIESKLFQFSKEGTALLIWHEGQNLGIINNFENGQYDLTINSGPVINNETPLDIVEAGTVILSNSVSDQDGDTLTFVNAEVISGGAGGTLLVTEGTENEVYYTTPKTHSGLDTIQVTVTDGIETTVGQINVMSHALLTGTEYKNNLEGAEGNDTIRGLEGNDTLKGGSGDDLLIGGKGVDELWGGEGADIFRYEQSSIADQNDIIKDFELGVDKIDVRDIFTDETGMLILKQKNGKTELFNHDKNLKIKFDTTLDFTNDDIMGAEIKLYQNGDNSGNRLTATESDNNWLVGGDGNDTIVGSDGDDVLIGDEDTELISINSETVAVESQVDSASSNADEKQVYSLFGPASVPGRIQNDDHLLGGAGNDNLTGGLGADTLEGGEGDDIFHYDTLQDSNAGNMDLIKDFEIGSDKIDFSEIAEKIGIPLSMVLEHSGNNTILKDKHSRLKITLEGDLDIEASDLMGATLSEQIKGTRQGDELRARNGISTTLNGGVGNDKLYGADGDDYLHGGTGRGSDALYGGDGNDTLKFNADQIVHFGDAKWFTKDLFDGGDGYDVIQMGGKNESLTINERGHGAGIKSIEEIRAGGGDDYISLTYSKYKYYTDTLIKGEKGNDSIHAGYGNDTIDGGEGKDLLYGGAGDDTFVFSKISDSTDTAKDIIYDFSKGSDQIDLRGIDSIDEMNDLSITHTGSTTMIEDNNSNFAFELQGQYELMQDDFVFA